jgi:hypothetical protein
MKRKQFFFLYYMIVVCFRSQFVKYLFVCHPVRFDRTLEPQVFRACFHRNIQAGELVAAHHEDEKWDTSGACRRGFSRPLCGMDIGSLSALYQSGSRTCCDCVNKDGRRRCAGNTTRCGVSARRDRRRRWEIVASAFATALDATGPLRNAAGTSFGCDIPKSANQFDVRERA